MASSTAATPSPSAPSSINQRIQPLPKTVVDRIAAGEVVQRPASVAKELLENSLDAASTTIDVQCQSGGLRLLTVTDDGDGISPSDLKLAATRFATSKLVCLDDLKSIRTFGFRGEALASASMVSRLTITSRRKKKRPRTASANGSANNSANDNDDDDGQYSTSCAYKRTYRDGIPTTPKPTPSAGRVGTTIKVEDLFYNVPSRRRAFAGNRKEAEEYTKVLSVAQRYAIHQSGRGVGLVCRKKGGQADLNTSGLPSVRALKEKRLKMLSGAANGVDTAATAAAAVSNAMNGVATSTSSNGSATRDVTIEITESEAQQATKDVIGHVFGTSVARELLVLKAGEGDVEAVSLAALEIMRKEQHQDKKQDGKDKKQNGASNGNNGVPSAAMELEAALGEGGEAQQQPSSSDPTDTVTDATNNKPGRYTFAYRASGFLTNGSYCVPKSSSAFVLFINDRLVESPPLKRAVESVYADSLPKGAKPFVYVSLELPGPHVDVNVHPTKREVAFLHEDRLCEALANATRTVLGSAQASRTFYAQAVLPRGGGGLGAGGVDAGTIDRSAGGEGTAKALSSSTSKTQSAASTSRIRAAVGAATMRSAAGSSSKSQAAEKNVLEEENTGTNGDNTSNDDNDAEESTSRGRKRKADDSPAASRSSSVSSSSTKKKSTDPKKLVRTNSAAPAGALEPFLVSTQSQLSQSQSQSSAGANGSGDQEVEEGRSSGTATTFQHAEDCDFARGSQTVDMSVPGAFATAICRCQVERGNTLPPVRRRTFAESSVPASSGASYRPKKLAPTPCSYSSIQTLRADITARAHRDLTTKLRDSSFVGCVSRSRSLIQWGIELLMINHIDLGRELFYQLALSRFGGAQRADLGEDGISVEYAIEQAMQLEQNIASGMINSEAETTTNALEVSDTNRDLASQSVMLLSEKADMLDEYFSIRFQKKADPTTGKETLLLVGLPVLLEGHSPPPHALPLFLLRLATEVDWTSERECFHDVCTELGNYYAEIPFDLDPTNTDAASESSSQNKDDSATSEAGANDSSSGNSSENGAAIIPLIDEAAKHFVKHTLYPAISFLLIPPKDFASDGAVVKLAVLSALYKVFERC